jgi:hypothetical protein
VEKEDDMEVKIWKADGLGIYEATINYRYEYKLMGESRQDGVKHLEVVRKDEVSDWKPADPNSLPAVFQKQRIRGGV